MKYLYLLFIYLTLLLTACGGTEPTASTQIIEQPVAASATDTAVPTNTSIPATATIELPATEALPTETATSAALSTSVAPLTEPPTPTPPLLAATEPAIQVVSGQLPDGAFFLGDVNAPLTVIDYSDFL